MNGLDMKKPAGLTDLSTDSNGLANIWWRFRDSNPGPADYDSVALTD